MSEKKTASSIRLSSRTAVSLRRCAGKIRLVCLAVGIVMTAGLFALAVFLGLRWLPAVPIIVAFTAFFDVILYVHAERVTLSLTSLALSAEQASRALRADMREEERKKTHEKDEAEIRQDVESRLASAEKPGEKIGEGSLSGTKIIRKDEKRKEEKRTTTRRMRPIQNPEETGKEKKESAEEPEVDSGSRRRRRNGNPGLTLIEGSK